MLRGLCGPPLRYVITIFNNNLKALSKHCEHATEYFFPKFLTSVIVRSCFVINFHQTEDVWLKWKKRFIKFSFGSIHGTEIYVGI